ncbi:hypothetical protein AGR4B_pAt10112 [Agrobacterium tumefaciens str. CFBP 5621]|nr:hypothetical protein AGR4B_pAt10112 [Agrobacterium tumefaciens str. CFBP 5621]
MQAAIILVFARQRVSSTWVSVPTTKALLGLKVGDADRRFRGRKLGMRVCLPDAPHDTASASEFIRWRTRKLSAEKVRRRGPLGRHWIWWRSHTVSVSPAIPPHYNLSAQARFCIDDPGGNMPDRSRQLSWALENCICKRICRYTLGATAQFLPLIQRSPSEGSIKSED